MAWSPPARERRIVGVSTPGDYATFNSNHTPDGTDETYPNCVSDLRYLRDKDSLPTDSVQFALTETRSLILDTTEVYPESVHRRIIRQDVE